MIKSIRFLRDYRCFKVGERFDFKPGINLLVGDQGCGKSSLLGLIRRYGNKDGEARKTVDIESLPIPMMCFDFEHDNPRTQKDFYQGSPRLILASRFQSHGETTTLILKALTESRKPTLYVMDEPDTSLSVRSCRVLVRSMRIAEDNGHQIIAAVHSLMVISAVPGRLVLSLEHRRWMSAKDFIEAHMKEVI